MQRSKTALVLNRMHWLAQVYSVQDSLLCLTGTAEVPLGAMYMDQILSEEQLPIKMAGFGHCFRTEAGAGGDHLTICWHQVEGPPPHQWWGVLAAAY